MSDKLELITKQLLEEIGEHPNREGLLRTPLRVSKAWKFFSKGYGQDLEKLINKLNNKYNPSTDCAHPLEHINLFKKDSFKEMIKDTNLQIVDIKSKYNFSLKNILLDLKNYLYFDSVLIKKINK